LVTLNPLDALIILKVVVVILNSGLTYAVFSCFESLIVFKMVKVFILVNVAILNIPKPNNG